MKLCPLSSPGKHGTECVWYYPAFAAFTVVALLVRKTTFRPRKLTGLRLAGDFDFLSFGKCSLVLVLLVLLVCVCVCVCVFVCVCVCESVFVCLSLEGYVRIYKDPLKDIKNI